MRKKSTNKIKMLNGTREALIDLNEFFKVKRRALREQDDAEILNKIKFDYCIMVEEYGYPFTNYLYVHLSQFDSFLDDFINAELPGTFIMKYNKSEPMKVFDFSPILLDENIYWSNERIKKYAPVSALISSRFWMYLFSRDDVKVDSSLFSEIEKWISFDELSSFRNFDWTADFIIKYIDRLNFQKLSGNSSLPWSESFILSYFDSWTWGYKEKTRQYNRYTYGQRATYGDDNCFSKPCISNNVGIFWTVELFDKFKHKLDLWIFTRNAKFEPEIFILYKELFLETEQIYHTHRNSDGSHSIEYEVPRILRYWLNPNFNLNQQAIKWAKSTRIDNIYKRDGENYQNKPITIWDFWEQNIKSTNIHRNI